jgi:hypothetical protein
MEKQATIQYLKDHIATCMHDLETLRAQLEYLEQVEEDGDMSHIYNLHSITHYNQ